MAIRARTLAHRSHRHQKCDRKSKSSHSIDRQRTPHLQYFTSSLELIFAAPITSAFTVRFGFANTNTYWHAHDFFISYTGAQPFHVSWQRRGGFLWHIWHVGQGEWHQHVNGWEQRSRNQVPLYRSSRHKQQDHCRSKRHQSFKSLNDFFVLKG